MKYKLYLFDADDTLFDFAASERASFQSTFSEFNLGGDFEEIYSSYKVESSKLWKLLEQGEVTKDFLRAERFRRIVDLYNLDADPEKLSELYLDFLPEQVHLKDHATEICQELSDVAQVGIITNGIDTVQKRRLKKSGLEKYISFMVVSEECGHAKPDSRFFEYTMTKTNGIDKKDLLVIGDRLETDILGAQQFGLDSCWYNPEGMDCPPEYIPTYVISHLSEVKYL